MNIFIKNVVVVRRKKEVITITAHQNEVDCGVGW